MLRHIQFLLAILILLIFSSLFIFLPISYVYWSGKSFIEEIQSQTKNRALEVGVALNTLSGESFYYDNMISLSYVMAKIVEHTNTREDPYQIKEIFLIDQKERLIAHSDITKLAKDMQEKYDPIKYKFNELLFVLNPITIDIIGYADIQIPEVLFKKNIENFVQKYLKNLLPNKFHVYTNIYPPDERLPVGSLHIIIHNYGISTMITKWVSDMINVILISVVISILFFLTGIIYLYYTIYKKSEIIVEEIKELEDKDLEELPEDTLAPDAQEIEEIKKVDIEPPPPPSEKIKTEQQSGKEIPIQSLISLKESKKNRVELQNKTDDVLDAIPIE